MPTVKAVSLIADSGQSTKTEITSERVYLVEFTDNTATQANIWGATDGVTAIPILGSIYASTIVNAIRPVRSDADPCVWTVTVNGTSNYNSNAFKPAGTGVVWDLHFRSTGVVYTEPAIKDRSATPVELRKWNGEPVDPQLPLEYFDEEFGISFKCDIIDMATLAATRGCVNDASVTMTVRGVIRTFGANTLRLLRADYSDYWENGVQYWQVELVIQYRADTWVDKIQPMSYQILDASGNLFRPKDPKTGQFYCTPQFLASDGKSFIPVGTALPTPMSFQMFYVVSFSTLLASVLTIP